MLLITVFLQFSLIFTAEVLQHPKEQCVLVGSNASFSCSARDSRSSTITTHWLVRFSNASEYEILHENDQADVHIHNHQPVQGTREYSSSLTVVISHSNMLRWNSAHFLCDFHGSKRFQSDIAILAIYTSLRPLPPSNISITTFDTSTIRLSWTPTFLCREYQIDGFNVNITNINSSQRIFETSIAFQNSTEIDRLNLTDTNVLQPCTEFNFSISSVSATYGESDSSFIIGGFDEAPNQVSIISNVLFFHANGSPLVDLEIQLPTTVCPYQDIIYSIVVREGWSFEFNQTLSFHRQGSGNVQHRIISGLNRNKNYSVSVMVKTVVGDSENSTNFDTNPWLEVADDNITCDMTYKTINISSLDCGQCLSAQATTLDYPLLITANSEDAVSDSNTLILYIILLSVLLAVVVLILVIIIAILFAYFCTIKGKRKYGGHNTQKRVMVHNPIYNQGSIPVYDTIPTLSETLADSEVNGASKFLGFKSSSSTFKAANAYVDAPHNSPSQRNPLDNASFNSRGNVAKNCITSPSLECVQNVVADAENGEESYTLMLPSGAVANSK